MKPIGIIIWTEKISNLLKQNSFDEKLYEDLNYVMRDSSICGLGQSAGNCINHFFKFFFKN